MFKIAVDFIVLVFFVNFIFQFIKITKISMKVKSHYSLSKEQKSEIKRRRHYALWGMIIMTVTIFFMFLIKYG
jgi:hypothetical protein